MNTSTLDKENLGIIDINSPHSPEVLSGILGISIPMVYAGRKDGKLPAHITATYKECIQTYISFYKNKVAAKSGNMYEAKLEQDIRNGRAKEELSYLEIKKQKEEFVDLNELSEMFVPIFQIVKSNLVNLARKYPETQKDIDRTLSSWYSLGTKIADKARVDSLTYVREQLDKPVELPEAEDEAINRFGIGEIL